MPSVDCLLLLRPTSSATLFTQQLGRGLRTSAAKSHLTVIDMIGQHRRDFRFEDRLGAILDRKRGPVERQVKDRFPFLPAGCTIDLDRQSEAFILENLKAASTRSRWTNLVGDLQSCDSLSLADYLDSQHHRIEDVYRSKRSWTQLKRDAGRDVPSAGDFDLEKIALRNISRLTHVDDPERIEIYRRTISGFEPPALSSMEPRRRRLLTMLAWGLGSKDSGLGSLDEFFGHIWRETAVKGELLDLFESTDRHSVTRLSPIGLASDIPLSIHARYSREEIVAALGHGEGIKPPPTREGILWVESASSDAFFIDLHKAERDYSPSTMYHDYAINRHLFHWESQSGQAPHQPVVQRYIHHRERGSNVLLFVREQKKSELGTQPYTYLGPAEYLDHKGEKPVQFRWQLKTPMPEELFEVARSVAAA